MAERRAPSVKAIAGFDPREFVRNLTRKPGVYRMLDGDGRILYVGKARNLKRRVGSYFSGRAQDAKTIALVRQVAGIEVTVTRTEAEALMLEYNLIKAHRPRYNVLLKDDKSYPYIHLSSADEFPRLSFYRGSRKVAGELFGPYPNAGSVRETLNQLQKLFRIRQCEDTQFRGRSRPCLQYQIGRCTGPCVGLVTAAEYARDVENARLFLRGHSDAVVERIAEQMEDAAEAQAYERAAQLRDRLLALKKVQSSQLVARGHGEFDLVAAVAAGGIFCVTVMYFRGGRSLGSRDVFPRQVATADLEEVIRAFLLQYYTERDVPAEIIVNQPVPDGDVIAAVLSERTGHRVAVKSRVRGDRAKLLRLAASNALHAAEHRGLSRASVRSQLAALTEALGLEAEPSRLECFDISHTAGEATVGSCVVFDENGPLKSDYRRYNIADVAAGDDYAAMRQVLRRRFGRVVSGEATLPDVLLIDGGRGQLGAAVEVLTELAIAGVEVIGVAKGAGRRPGRESLYRPGRQRPLRLPPDSPALTLIQRLRDESHRFAIAGHRARRQKRLRKSALDEIGGLGPKRRQALLRHFGGLQGIAGASADDLARVRGISPALAERIYERFHSD